MPTTHSSDDDGSNSISIQPNDHHRFSGMTTGNTWHADTTTTRVARGNTEAFVTASPYERQQPPSWTDHSRRTSRMASTDHHHHHDQHNSDGTSCSTSATTDPNRLNRHPQLQQQQPLPLPCSMLLPERLQQQQQEKSMPSHILPLASVFVDLDHSFTTTQHPPLTNNINNNNNRKRSVDAREEEGSVVVVAADQEDQYEPVPWRPRLVRTVAATQPVPPPPSPHHSTTTTNTSCSTSSSHHNSMTNHRSSSSSSSSSSSTNSTSLLHTTCKLFPQSRVVVESALQFDPAAIAVAIPTVCSSWYDAATTTATATLHHSLSHPPQKQPMHHYNNNRNAPISNDYSFPINIALQHDATVEVIHLLAQANPGVLCQYDGPNRTGSLSIALSATNQTVSTNKPQASTEHESVRRKSMTIQQPPAIAVDATTTTTSGTPPPPTTDDQSRMDQMVRVLMTANPDCVHVLDRRNNTALHYLARCMEQVSCETMTLVHTAYPQASQQRNWLGQTPLQVAQRNSTISDRILDHWVHLTCQEQEDTLEQSLRLIDVEIDATVHDL
jgi:hypothetical protein